MPVQSRFIPNLMQVFFVKDRDFGMSVWHVESTVLERYRWAATPWSTMNYRHGLFVIFVNKMNTLQHERPDIYQFNAVVFVFSDVKEYHQ